MSLALSLVVVWRLLMRTTKNLKEAEPFEYTPNPLRELSSILNMEMITPQTQVEAPDSGRRVLFVAYHYPPMRSAGTQRSAKFGQYLPAFGYQPVALTTSAFGDDRQGALADGVLRAWEPVGVYRRWRNPAARQDAAAAARVRTGGPRSWLRRWRERWLIPDGQITWLPAAAMMALRHLQAGQADLIYTSSPPPSSLLLGRFLRRQTGLPWIADLRDAWTFDPLDPELLRHPFRRAIEERMEAGVVADADLIITATHTAADDLRRRYPAAARRLRVITNGFDPMDAAVLPEGRLFNDDRGQQDEVPPPEPMQLPAAGEPLRLVHTGSFSYSHPLRSPVPLLTALKHMLADDPRWADRFKLQLVGDLAPDEAVAATSLVAAGMVELVGSVDRATALDYQRRSHLLVLVDHPRPWPASNAPGKLFEYLSTRRPILALCGAGEVRRMVTELGAGFCAPPSDVNGIRAALVEVWSRFRTGALPVCEADLQRFHRRNLTRQLAACFDEVLETA